MRDTLSKQELKRNKDLDDKLRQNMEDVQHRQEENRFNFRL